MPYSVDKTISYDERLTMPFSGRWLIFGLLLILLPKPIHAQNVDCSARSINARLDAVYERYLNQRSDVNAVEARDQLLTLQNDILSIISACPPERVEEEDAATETPTNIPATIAPTSTNIPPTTQAPPTEAIATETTTVESTETATETAIPTTTPTIEATSQSSASDSVLGDTGDGVLMRVVEITRPANSQIEAANRYNAVPSAGSHYLLVTLEVECRAEREAACDITPFHFRLSTDAGTFDPPFVVYENELDTRLEPGQATSGDVPFLVPQNAANMRLLYYPQAIFGDAPPITFELNQ